MDFVVESLEFVGSESLDSASPCVDLGIRGDSMRGKKWRDFGKGEIIKQGVLLNELIKRIWIKAKR